MKNIFRGKDVFEKYGHAHPTRLHPSPGDAPTLSSVVKARRTMRIFMGLGAAALITGGVWFWGTNTPAFLFALSVLGGTVGIGVGIFLLVWGAITLLNAYDTLTAAKNRGVRDDE